MDMLLEDAEFVIGELGLEKPTVVGHSWGATVALELVGTRPGLASALVFIDGPVQSAANMFSWEDAQRLMQPPLPRFTTFADAIAESQRDFGRAWDDDLESFVEARRRRRRRRLCAYPHRGSAAPAPAGPLRLPA
jgi:pimeloyl-ACP methyl ester carboxylesterase